MFEWFDSLSTGMQLVVVGGGLLVLFFVVRLNARSNKNKLQKRRQHDFSTRMRERHKTQEENSSNTEKKR